MTIRAERFMKRSEAQRQSEKNFQRIQALSQPEEEEEEEDEEELVKTRVHEAC